MATNKSIPRISGPKVPEPSKFEKNTKNQHVYSVAELLMNAINPEAGRNKALINKFEIVERDPPKLRPTDQSPVQVKKEMCFTNLFTLDKSGSTQKNFENFFGQYESEISLAVSDLKDLIDPICASINLNKTNHKDVTHIEALDAILFRIWALKFMNIARNPFGIRKFMNSLPGEMSNYYPTDPELKEVFDLIDGLTESDLDFRLEELDVSIDEYKEWLKSLFILFLPSGDINPDTGKHFKSMIEHTAHSLFHDPNSFSVVGIHVLSDAFKGRFFLSDRSYFYSSNESEKLALHFNVTSQIAISFMMIDPNSMVPDQLKEILEKSSEQEKQKWLLALQESRKEMSSTLQKRVFLDDVEWSRWFNEATIFQAYRHVYCQAKDELGFKQVEN